MKFGIRFEQLTDWSRQRGERRRMRIVYRREQQTENMREQVDAILDKINRVGYDALSDADKAVLKRASHFLSREED